MGYQEGVKWSKKTWYILEEWQREEDWEENAFVKRLEKEFQKLGKQRRKVLMDATALAAYHARMDEPVLQVLVCDDAPQFNWLGHEMMLCRVHEGRPCKKFQQVMECHRKLLDDYLTSFWAYYEQLLAYREKPTTEDHKHLEKGFDTLFATRTGYDALDERIAKTSVKKDSLLLVLKYPELPPHNNASELGV